MASEVPGFGPNNAFSAPGFRFGSLDSRNMAFRYPSPWWDVAHMNLPTSVKHLFAWCGYHLVANPLVSSVTKKMASYPLTEVVIEEEPSEGFTSNKKRWESVFATINLKSFQQEVGLDYYGYGNCFVSILFPFKKYLVCRSCKHLDQIKKLRYKKDWNFRDYKYILKCAKCSTEDVAAVRDEYYRSYREIKLVRWAPQDINIDHNPINQTSEYSYSIPANVRAKVTDGNRRYLEELPDDFIQAIRGERPVLLHPDNLFHFKADTPSFSGGNDGWGYPLILPALKDSFYLQIMKKAQEAVMLEHLLPLDIFYPASADQTANPYLAVNLSNWKAQVEMEIMKWRWDPNYKPVLPLPVGHQRVGGDGRALMLTQEIRAWSEHIIAGMTVPQEFVFGGLTWSGSSVSLRMLENQFLSYRLMHEHFLDSFLVPHISQFMGWVPIKTHMRQFKMADDMQSKQLLMNLNQLKKVSDKTLLSEFGLNALEEAQVIETELRRSATLEQVDTLSKADIQGQAQEVQTKYQIRAQEQMQNAAQAEQAALAGAGGEAPPSIHVDEMAQGLAKKLVKLPPDQQQHALGQIAASNPQLKALVQKHMMGGQPAASGMGQNMMSPTDMRPLPEQRPPRREGAPM